MTVLMESSIARVEEELLVRHGLDVEQLLDLAVDNLLLGHSPRDRKRSIPVRGIATAKKLRKWRAAAECRR